jgi:aminotransferase
VGIAPQAAALAALDGPRDWLEEAHAQLGADRDVAIAAVEASGGLAFVRPGGGPFLFVSAGREGLAEKLVAAGIPAVDGRHFQAPAWARVPFGGAAAAADALEAALGRWSETRRLLAT